MIVASRNVIVLCFRIVDIAAVAEGVGFCQGFIGGCGIDIAPGVVGVLHQSRSGAVQNGGNVTLKICCVIVGGAVAGHAHRRTAGIVGKVQGNRRRRTGVHRGGNGHLAERTAIVHILVSHRLRRNQGSCCSGTLDYYFLRHFRSSDSGRGDGRNRSTSTNYFPTACTSPANHIVPQSICVIGFIAVTACTGI